jgi:hypothetical protein
MMENVFWLGKEDLKGRKHCFGCVVAVVGCCDEE